MKRSENVTSKLHSREEIRVSQGEWRRWAIREGDEAITATAPHTTYTLTMNTLDYVVQSWHLSQKLFHKEQNFKFSIE